MTNYTEQLAFATKWAKDRMLATTREFAKDPSGTNWTVCERAMMTYQQINFAVRSSTVDRAKLVFDLENNVIGVWPDVICRATLGLTCDDAIRQYGSL